MTDGGIGLDTASLLTTTGITIWSVTSANQGTARSSDTVSGLDFTGVESLVGGSNADQFVISELGSLSGSITAGSDLGDHLNLTAFRSSVTVNLAARSATSVLGGWSGIDTFSATTGSLVGADTDATWTVSGINAGSITSSQEWWASAASAT